MCHTTPSHGPGAIAEGLPDKDLPGGEHKFSNISYSEHIRYASKKTLHTVVFTACKKLGPDRPLTVLLPYFDQPFTSA